MIETDAAWRQALTQAAGQSIILASASPRRKELLTRAGVEFEITVSDAPEALPERNESPVAYALRSAREKAFTVAQQHPGRLILGADTVVAVADRILGKPADAQDAAAMLRLLSGREHEVHTGCAIAVGNGETRAVAAFAVTSKVTFRLLTDEEIELYVASGEPLDKAGAYGIQGLGGQLVASVEGSYDNIVGLPVAEVVEALERLCSGVAAGVS